MRNKVYLDPRCRIQYSNYYILGLYKNFGKKNVTFSMKHFEELESKKEPKSYDQYFAFIIENENSYKKFIIDFRDKTNVKPNAYYWSDVYAKINFNLLETPKIFHEKIVPIPPSFGIQIWNKYELFYYCFSNLIKMGFSPLEGLKTHFREYKNELKRTSLDKYLKIEKTKDNFTFLIGSLWPHKNCIESTNLYRKDFIEMCVNNGVEFEGGFIGSKNHPQYLEFEEYILRFGYDINEYINQTKSSSFVFNTPAVFNCHGWKLGEYLAMGKAIISTPLSNELPEKLEHGENIHFINSTEELSDAINLIKSDADYRDKLEKGAAEYYNKHVAPSSVIKHITNSFD